MDWRDHFKLEYLHNLVAHTNMLYSESSHGLHPIQFDFVGLEDFDYGMVTNKEYMEQGFKGPWHKSDMINVYILPRNNFAPCGRATWPWLEDQGIELNLLCLIYSFNGEHSILAHELGHMFGLIHTHEGNPRESGYYPYLELVTRDPSRGNCEEAGDFLCDTPADPCLSRENVTVDCENCEQVQCSYTGYDSEGEELAFDEEGNPYEPDVYNIMSYTPDECMRSFTQGQSKRMHNAIEWSKEVEDVKTEIVSDVIAYPNPSKGPINITFNVWKKNYEVFVTGIYDVLGRKVNGSDVIMMPFYGNIAGEFGKVKLIWTNNAHLASGIYFIRIRVTSEGQEVYHKAVKVMLVR